ncbi:MAG TPA: transposase [Propionicimonas sp.]|jgi:hypothetical protein|nr:transposase [Propionicimonas sp.]
MKPNTFMFVVVADQVDSRRGVDQVPAALDALADLPLLLPFERTAGDEIQALCAEPKVIPLVVSRLTRLDGWRIGIGAGEVEAPLPDTTRAARGTAYLAARAAIVAARRSPVQLAFCLPSDVSGEQYRGELEAAEDAETSLWLLRSVLSRRSREGWELMDLLDGGLSNARAAAELGISASAASQRLARAGRAEASRGELLAARLLGRLQRVFATRAEGAS